MADSLTDGDWRLIHPGADLVFGSRGRAVFNRTAPDLGDFEIRTADATLPRADGVNFGVDYLGGRTITFDLGAWGETEEAVRLVVSDLASAWRGDEVRGTPGAVAELRSRYRGIERVVFGRPRRFAPVLAEARTGRLASITADFACADDLFYDSAPSTATVSLVPSPSGGLLAPLRTPLSTTRGSDRSTGLTVVTQRPAWPVVEIFGPITSPVVDVNGVLRFALALSIPYDQSVVIDTRPWARTVLLAGANAAGALTRTSTRLSRAAMPAGRHEFSLRGEDVTGTSRARLTWRGAYTTP